MVSLDSLEAMAILEMKSLLDWAANASETLAPILVPDLRICLPMSYSFAFFNSLYKLRIFKAKEKLLSPITLFGLNGVPFSIITDLIMRKCTRYFALIVVLSQSN